MMHAPYNLATRPFRNQRLPALLLGLGWALLLGATVAHTFAARRLLPASTSARHQDVAELSRRLERLDARAAGFKLDVPEATLDEWLFVKDLVDRRAFSWTRLLQDLGQALPSGVRVTSVAPDVDDGRLMVEINAAMRAPQDALELVRSLEDSPQFADVTPVSAGDSVDGRQMRVQMSYEPPPASAVPAARPASGRRARKQP